MTPPISIDGPDITGATIDGTDVQEITVDGQTVFTAEPPIPSSAIHRYKLDEGSGTTATDSIGSRDGTINNASYVSGNFQGGFALDFDGATTSVVFGPPVLSGSGAIGITVVFDDTQSTQYIVSGGQQSNNPISYQLIIRDSQDHLEILTFDGSNNVFSSVSMSQFNTTDKFRILFQSDGNEFEIYSNGVLVSTVDSSGNGFLNLNTTAALGAQVKGGSFLTNRFDGKLDDMIIYSTDLTASEIQQDFDAQPWSP